jgi:hypothetical protein
MNTLLRMVYISTTTHPVSDSVGGVQKDVGRILMQARRNNPAHKLGGVLYFSNNYFFQCLEGEQEAVNNLYRKILHDPRHTDVQTVLVKRIDQRQFANWSMKYVASRDKVTQLLFQHGLLEFNPYEFDEVMIEKMLALFTSVEDSTGNADQDYHHHEPTAKHIGLWSRLLRRKKAA